MSVIVGWLVYFCHLLFVDVCAITYMVDIEVYGDVIIFMTSEAVRHGLCSWKAKRMSLSILILLIMLTYWSVTKDLFTFAIFCSALCVMNINTYPVKSNH